MMDASIFEFFKKTILDINDIDEGLLVPEIQIMDIGLESLDFVEIQVSVMKEYGVKLSPGIFINGEIKTLGQLVDYVDGKRNEPAVVQAQGMGA